MHSTRSNTPFMCLAYLQRVDLFRYAYTMYRLSLTALQCQQIYSSLCGAPALPIAPEMASSRAGLTPREGREGFTRRNLEKTMTNQFRALEVCQLKADKKTNPTESRCLQLWTITKWFLQLSADNRERSSADQGKCLAAKSYEKNVRKATLYKRSVLLHSSTLDGLSLYLRRI